MLINCNSLYFFFFQDYFSKLFTFLHFWMLQKRDILSRTKQARDALRIDNQRLRQSCGLLGNEPLLRDFEERKDESDDLRERLERLKMTHAELTLNCNQVRRKIEQARQNRGWSSFLDNTGELKMVYSWKCDNFFYGYINCCLCKYVYIIMDTK